MSKVKLQVTDKQHLQLGQQQMSYLTLSWQQGWPWL
jgi:hypothetical protein